ncbi:hypothetical protein ACLKA6_007967 [Drosophila palustris]
MNEWTQERERERIKGKWETSKTPGDILNVAQKNDYRLSRCNRHKTTDNKWDTVVGGGEKKGLWSPEISAILHEMQIHIQFAGQFQPLNSMQASLTVDMLVMHCVGLDRLMANAMNNARVFAACTSIYNVAYEQCCILLRQPKKLQLQLQ